MEYISLHGYIRNKPSDTDVHAEDQLRADRSTCRVPAEKDIPAKEHQQKRIYRTKQNSVGQRS